MICITLLACGVVSTVQAVGVSVSTQSEVIHAGDTRLFSIMVDTGGKEINAIEGSLVSSDAIGEILTGGSVFTLWPTIQKKSPTSVEFVGGTPSAVFGNKIKALSFEVTLDASASVDFVLQNMVLFVADGKGTTISIPQQKISLSVSPADDIRVDEKKEFFDSDTQPPLVSVTPIQDTDLYGDGVVLILNATDEKTGVAYFRIQEGDISTTTTDTLYRLQNTEYKGRIKIEAFDKAGNSVTTYVRLYPTSPRYYMLIGFALLVVCVMLGRFLFRKKNQFRV